MIRSVQGQGFPFIGRVQYLGQLDGIAAEAAGGALWAVRGRRRVGKSRLIQEWLDRSNLPYVFYQATKVTEPRAVANFSKEVAASSLLAASTFRAGVSVQGWEAAFRVIAASATGPAPSVVVIDEFPWLKENDPGIETTFQVVWDRVIEKRAPVIIILIGSDIRMMTMLTEHPSPLYGRAREMVIKPFSPQEVSDMLGVDPVACLDAYLVAGGFPLLTESWKRNESMWDFLGRSLADPSSPLLTDGLKILTAEFPEESRAREVLSAIGDGSTTFTTIQQGVGANNATLARALKQLIGDKLVVKQAQPLSGRGFDHEPRYFVAEPYLRFWLRFLQWGSAEVERGRGDLVLQRIKNGWQTYAGRAIEPIVREAVENFLPDDRFGTARYCGAYWTRDNQVEIDLVGVDRLPRPTLVSFAGSIKWRARSAFDDHDVGRLRKALTQLPEGGDPPLLVGVARAGFSTQELDVRLDAGDIVASYDRYRR